MQSKIMATLTPDPNTNKNTDHEQDALTSPVTGNPRTEARLMAVQALYQFLLLGGEGEADILNQFVSRHVRGRKGDGELFSTLFKNAISERERYQALIEANLSENWEWSRIGYVEQALLLSAIAELDVRQDTPTKVVLNEFINIAHSYFEKPEVSFINSILDKAAKALRG